MRKKNLIRLGGGAFVAMSVMSGLAQAVPMTTTLYDSGGFESAAGFTLTGGYDPTQSPSPGLNSSIFGQSATAYSATSTVWETGAGAGTSDAFVETGVKYGSGSQAVEMSRSLSDHDTYYATFLSNASTISGAQPYVVVSWMMQYAPGATNDPFFGIYGWNGNDPLGYAGVDATTGDILINTAGSTDTADLSEDNPLLPNQWYHFQLQYDYLTHTESVFVNGSYVGGGAFASGLAEPGITDADITSFANAQTGSGAAYFDNYVITSSSSPVPEPTSGGMLLIGSAFGALSRRRSKTDRKAQA